MTGPSEQNAALTDLNHWKQIAHDRVVSANALLIRARAAEAAKTNPLLRVALSTPPKENDR